MTTVRQVTRRGAGVLPPSSVSSAHSAEPLPGARHQRRLEHRRLVREQIIAAFVLAVVLVVTLLLLGLQWLNAAVVGL
jgi:hypothetical protein